MKRTLLLIFVLFGFPWVLCSQSISWKQLSGPHGGYINTMVVDEVGNLYASSTHDNKGPYKSTDGGVTWVSIKNGTIPYEYSGLYCPINISTNGSLFLAIGSDGFPSNTYVYRSTDGGNNWTISFIEPSLYIFCISSDQTGNIYLGTSAGIYKSSDDGNNWAKYGAYIKYVEGLAFNANGHVFVSKSEAVYRSTDDGASWIRLPELIGIKTLAIKNDGTIFAGGETPDGGIWRSTDNGDSWKYVSPKNTKVKKGSTAFIDSNGDIYFPTYGEGVLKSTDNGDNWTKVNNGLSNNYIFVVTKSTTGNFFAASEHAIYKSIDGCASWFSVGRNICKIQTLAINKNNDIFTVEKGKAISRSTDGGLSWQMVYTYDRPEVVLNLAISKSTGSIFAGCTPWASGLVIKSTDNGNSWSRCDVGFPHDPQYEDDAVNAIAINSSGHVFAFGYSSWAPIDFMSIDDGNTWAHIRGPKGVTGIAFNSTMDIFVSTREYGIWRRLQGETNWTNLTSGNYYSIYVGSNDYIYSSKKRSTDNGNTWTTMTIDGNNITSYTENSLGHLFCGSKNQSDYNSINPGSGVFRSTDYGDTWEKINNGLPILDIRSLAVDSDDYLYAGTWGQSVYRTATSTTYGIDVIPSVSGIVKVFPNPAKETLWLAGTDKLDGNKEINIYDLNGRMVIQKHFSALTEVLELDVSALKSGIYFCRITTKDLSVTKKIIIQR